MRWIVSSIEFLIVQVEGMLTPSEGGLQAQLLEIMRMLLDSETMDTVRSRGAVSVQCLILYSILASLVYVLILLWVVLAFSKLQIGYVPSI